MSTVKIVGKVTPEERDVIKKLHQRRVALHELLSSIPGVCDSTLYEKIVEDVGATVTAYHEWWDEKAIKYDWPRGKHWDLNFTTREVSVTE